MGILSSKRDPPSNLVERLEDWLTLEREFTRSFGIIVGQMMTQFQNVNKTDNEDKEVIDSIANILVELRTENENITSSVTRLDNLVKSCEDMGLERFENKDNTKPSHVVDIVDGQTLELETKEIKEREQALYKLKKALKNTLHNIKNEIKQHSLKARKSRKQSNASKMGDKKDKDTLRHCGPEFSVSDQSEFRPHIGKGEQGFDVCSYECISGRLQVNLVPNEIEQNNGKGQVLNDVMKNPVDRKIKQRKQTKKRKRTVQIQFYHKRNDEIMNSVVQELHVKLNSQMESHGVRIDVIQNHKASEIKADLPVLVFCISTSRLGSDVSNALAEIESTERTALLVFHHKHRHPVLAHTSDQIATGADLGGIFDLVFQQKEGIYTCDLNQKTLKSLCEFIIANITRG